MSEILSVTTTTTSQEVAKNRIKSLLWRLGMMVLAALIAVALDNLDILNLSPEVTALIGLVLGEISKLINVDLGKLQAK